MTKDEAKKQHDLEADLKINRFKLELDCESQPNLYHYWAEELAKAKARVDTVDDRIRLLEGDLKDTRAKEELVIRAADPKTYQLDKFTEGSIASLLENRPGVVAKKKEIQDARQELLTAKEAVYHLDAAVKALEHRRDELDNLTKLWLGGYYAKPAIKETAGDAFGKESRTRLNEKG